MFCSRCGNNNPDNNQFCATCGQPLNAVAAAQTQTTKAGSSGGAPVLDARTDGKAIGSLILGVLAITFFWIFAGIPAIVLGHLSRSSIRKSMGRLKGEGMALAGLIMGDRKSVV